MNNYKSTKVVMLAHNSMLTKITKYLDTNKLSTNLDRLERHTNQHLYFTSDEIINRKDFVYNIVNKSIQRWDEEFKADLEYFKKVIASTNPDLNLPQPSNEFIQYYISEYNKGNIITEVLVEYDYMFLKAGDNDVVKNNPLVLKVNSDNTITIKPVIETWENIFDSWLSSKECKMNQHFGDWLKLNFNPPTKKNHKMMLKKLPKV